MLDLPEFIKADSVALYASFKSEVDTHGLIEKAITVGKRVILPRVNVPDWKLMLYEIKDIKELEKGYMDIPEPPAVENMLTNLYDDIDVFIIPGIAFDESGNRLGYSSGLYDKLLCSLNQNIPIIALAYEEQIVRKIFSEPHDIKVHKIITEKRIIECKQTKF